MVLVNSSQKMELRVGIILPCTGIIFPLSYLTTLVFSFWKEITTPKISVFSPVQ